ncbi:MAG: tetratricopeptide repeat protein [Myxococcaceae bacterium]
MHPLFVLLLPAVLAAGTADSKVADAAFQKHAWAKAAEAYQKLTQETPEDAVAWLRLGMSLVQVGRGADAIAPLEKAEKLGANADLAEYQLAQAAALSGDKGRALRILESLDEEDFFPVGPPAAQEKAFATLAGDPKFEKLSADLEVNRAPCKRGESASPYRQFDFWVGDWRVVDKAGNPVGTSHVERILGGCVLLETTRGEGGREGRSLSSWNPGQRRWEQYRIDEDGVPIFFTGGFDQGNGELQLRADSATRRGAPLKWRITFSKQPDGRLRQLAETSNDSGRTWLVEYDVSYSKSAGR